MPSVSSGLVAVPCVTRTVFGGRAGGRFMPMSSRAVWREMDCIGSRARGGQRKKAE